MYDPFSADDEDEAASGHDAPGFRAALRIRGAVLDPDFITQQLGVAPTTSTQHGPQGNDGAAATGHWEYALQLPPGTELGDGLDLLLARVPNDATLWQELADAYAVDVRCALEIDAEDAALGSVLHETSIDAAVLERLAHLGLPLRLVFVRSAPEIDDADADDGDAE